MDVGKRGVPGRGHWPARIIPEGKYECLQFLKSICWAGVCFWVSPESGRWWWEGGPGGGGERLFGDSVLEEEGPHPVVGATKVLWG